MIILFDIENKEYLKTMLKAQGIKCINGQLKLT